MSTIKRHRPVVFRRDLHIGSEFAVLRREAEAFALGKELLIKRNRQIGLGRADKARPAAVAHVAIERKLAHDKNASANVGERAVHFVVFIAEHPQPQHLFSQLPAKRRRIVRPNAKQNQKASSDFSVNSAVNRNTGRIHAGNDCFHSEILSFYRGVLQICRLGMSPTAHSFPSCRKRMERKGALGYVWCILRVLLRQEPII